MKLISIAIAIQILPFLILDTVFVKFGLSYSNSNADIMVWLMVAITALPLYYLDYQKIYHKKVLAIFLSIITFILMAIFSMIAGLLFHSKILNAPL